MSTSADHLARAARARLIARMREIISKGQQASATQDISFYRDQIARLLLQESQSAMQLACVPSLLKSQPWVFLAEKLEEEGFDFKIFKSQRPAEWLLDTIHGYRDESSQYLEQLRLRFTKLVEQMKSSSPVEAEKLFHEIGELLWSEAQKPALINSYRTEIERARRLSKDSLSAASTKQLIGVLANSFPAGCVSKEWLKASVGNYFFALRTNNPSAYARAKAFGVQFEEETGLTQKLEARHGMRGFRDTERLSPPPDLSRFAPKNNPRIIQGDFHALRQKAMDEKPTGIDGPGA